MKSLSRRISFASVSGYLLLLIVLPVGAIFQQAFSAGIEGFAHALAQPIGVAALVLTLKTSLITAGLNTVVGTGIAYAFQRMNIPGKSILNAMVDLPFAIPTTVSGLMLIFLYGPTSPAGAWFSRHGIHLIYSQIAIVIALLFVTFPYTVRAVQPLLEGIDVRTEEAALTLGASKTLIFRTLVLPALLPGVFSGFSLSFSRALAEFGAVVMVSGNLPMHTQVSAVYLYGLLENYDQQGSASISVVLLVISLIAVFYQFYIVRRKPFDKFLRILQGFGKRDSGEAANWVF